MDAVLIATPEYNRGIPAALKNALDAASRPYGKNVLNGKPASVVSASIGQIGGALANHAVRQALVFLNCPCMQQPEVYISQAQKLFDEQGILQESTQKLLKNFADSYCQWVEKMMDKKDGESVRREH